MTNADSPLTLEEYAAVQAAQSCGYDLAEVLRDQGVPEAVWETGEALWREAIVDDWAIEGSLGAQYDRCLRTAYTRYARRVEPLEEELEAWLAFFGKWSAHPRPQSILSRVGLHALDVLRLHELWSERFERDASLRRLRDSLLAENPPADAESIDLPEVTTYPAALEQPLERRPGLTLTHAAQLPSPQVIDDEDLLDFLRPPAAPPALLASNPSPLAPSAAQLPPSISPSPALSGYAAPPIHQAEVSPSGSSAPPVSVPTFLRTSRAAHQPAAPAPVAAPAPIAAPAPAPAPRAPVAQVAPVPVPVAPMPAPVAPVPAVRTAPPAFPPPPVVSATPAPPPKPLVSPGATPAGVKRVDLGQTVSPSDHKAPATPFRPGQFRPPSHPAPPVEAAATAPVQAGKSSPSTVMLNLNDAPLDTALPFDVATASHHAPPRPPPPRPPPPAPPPPAPPPPAPPPSAPPPPAPPPPAPPPPMPAATSPRPSAAPAPPRADLSGTRMATGPAGPALPFQPGAAVPPSPPPPPRNDANARRPSDSGTISAVRSPGPATPFDENQTVQGLTLRQYASLCVDAAMEPKREAEVFARYKLDVSKKNDLHDGWDAVMNTTPRLRIEWAEACSTYRKWCEKQKASS